MPPMTMEAIANDSNLRAAFAKVAANRHDRLMSRLETGAGTGGLNFRDRRSRSASNQGEPLSPEAQLA